MLDSDSDQLIVASTIGLAHKLCLNVVAEGGETEKHEKSLQALECDFGQGFYYSAAMPSHELLAFINRRRQMYDPIQESAFG